MRCLIGILVLASLLAPLASAGVIVEMLIDNAPVDLVMIPKGGSFTIDFSITSSDPFVSFSGLVALEGVGVLTEPTYPGYTPPVGIYPPPDEPKVPNQWPLTYPDWSTFPSPQGVFASSLYQATDWGNAMVRLYQFDETDGSLDLIDTLTIQVTIVPEPCTLVLLGAGAVLIHKRKLFS